MNSKFQKSISDHYGQEGLLSKIKESFIDSGFQLDSLSVDDLSGVDEFHIGGRQATERIFDEFSFSENSQIADIGCGIGGAARYLANKFGCQVDGFDLTEDFILAGNELSKWVGLLDKVHLHLSAVDRIPFQSDSIDFAYMFHVGMNVPDKFDLFKQVSTVLKRNSTFVIYDVMRDVDRDQENPKLVFPVPWAEHEEMDFSCQIEDYQVALEKAGFSIRTKVDHKRYAVEFFERMFVKNNEKGTDSAPPKPSLRQLVSRDFDAKMRNMVTALKNSVIRPVQLVAVKN